jgi:hypothetical protein
VQTTSSGWGSVVNSSYRPLNTGLQIAWNKTLVSGITFFTVGTSKIGGNDIIRGDANSTAVSFFDKYSYVDETAYLENWSIDRQIGQFPFGMIMAQADVQLNNTSKRFLPNFDATIGSGILPNRPLEISAGMNSDSLLQFTGSTGQPTISTTNRNVLLHAYDVMDYLNNYQFTSASGTTFSGMATNTTTTSGIAYYLGVLGFNPNQYALDPSLIDKIPFIDVVDKKFGDVIQDLMSAEQGLFFASENGKINFWNKQHFQTTSGTMNFNLNYSNTVSLDYSHAPIINDVTVTAKPRAVSFFQRLWAQSTAATISAGQSLDIFANFSDSNGSLPVTSVTTPTYSATLLASSYYTTNAAANGSGAALNSYLTLTSFYNFGTSYKMTFKNTYTSPLYLTALELYGNPAPVSNIITQQYTDQTSITNYGKNPANNGQSLLINNDYVQSSAAATAIAFSIVSQYSQPNRHYTVEIFSNPALQIGDYGTITIPDTGQVKTVWITGKTDKLSPGGNLTQLLQLEERTLFTYFTIGTSTIGGTDVIAP